MKHNDFQPKNVITSEWCSRLQHRSVRMDVSVCSLWPSPDPTRFDSIIALSIRWLSCCMADSHWLELHKVKICRHNPNQIIILLPSSSDRKNSWRAWIALRIPFQPLNYAGPRFPLWSRQKQPRRPLLTITHDTESQDNRHEAGCPVWRKERTSILPPRCFVATSVWHWARSGPEYLGDHMSDSIACC